MDPPNPNPNDAPSLPAESAARLAALSLCGTRDLPPDFHTSEILDDDEGYLTSASRGGSSTSAWKEAPEGLHDDDKDGDDVSQPSPRSSGYAGERGSSLDDDADPDPDPDQDWARGKKHPHEVSSLQTSVNPHHPLGLRLKRPWTCRSHVSGRCFLFVEEEEKTFLHSEQFWQANIFQV
jgi:hypothetical protein